MKKIIFAPEIRIICFNSQDLIVTSIGDGSSLGGGVTEDDAAQIGGFAPGRYNPGIWD